MSVRHRLFATCAQAALFFTVASWALIFIILDLMPKAATQRGLSIAMIVVLPDALATWWISRRFRLDRSRGDARRAAAAFAVSAPMTLAVSYPLGGLLGSYAEAILGSRFILPVLLGFIFLLMIIVPGAVVAWALHPSGAVAESESK
jgi:hypothetical protein